AEGDLLVVTDRTDWWNVYAVDLTTGSLQRVAGDAYDIVEPHWVFDESRYAVGVDGVVAHVAAAPTGDRLVVGDTTVDIGCTSITSLRRAHGGALVMIGASYSSEGAVYRVADGHVDVLRPARELPFGTDYMPAPAL